MNRNSNSRNARNNQKETNSRNNKVNQRETNSRNNNKKSSRNEQTR